MMMPVHFLHHVFLRPICWRSGIERNVLCRFLLADGNTYNHPILYKEPVPTKMKTVVIVNKIWDLLTSFSTFALLIEFHTVHTY
jgi:hypothetical protein